MNKIFLLNLFLFLTASSLYPTTHTITNSGFTFSPSTITITLGDTINFVLASIHNAEEVSQATWNANSNTSNGGFQTPFGGGIVVLQQAGTYYYVCQPHASMGMKGIITVTATTGIELNTNSYPTQFELGQNYPNPFNPTTSISFSIPVPSYVILKIYNLLGTEVQTLTQRLYNPGNYTASWDGSNVSSGVYFYQLVGRSTEENPSRVFTATRRLVLLK